MMRHNFSADFLRCILEGKITVNQVLIAQKWLNGINVCFIFVL